MTAATWPNPFVRTLAGAETRLVRLPRAVDITSVAPDGRTLVGKILDAKTGFDLWLFAAAADTPPKKLDFGRPASRAAKCMQAHGLSAPWPMRQVSVPMRRDGIAWAANEQVTREYEYSFIMIK